MKNTNHEVPTHLDVEDKVLFGLTVRQFLYLLVGSSASYSLWEQSIGLGEAPRATLVGLCLAVTLAVALVRPAGRALEEWLAAALVFAASPRQSTWQPREPLATDWRLAGASWQELAPSLVWAGDEQEESA
jgi:hypothetical protein